MMKRAQAVPMSTKYSCNIIHYLPLSLPLFRVILRDDVLPFIVVQDELPILEGLLQHLLAVLHI